MVQKVIVFKKFIPKKINEQLQAIFLITFLTSEHSIYTTKVVYMTGVMLDFFDPVEQQIIYTLGI